MTQVLTVPTHFNDIGELSEGFLDRVEQDTIILYGPVPYEDGSDIEFVVLLADGTSALEGKGRVRAAVDGGAERVPETRYDVVVEALALEGRFEVVFESLVMARQAVSEPPPAPDESSADSIDEGTSEETSAEADDPAAMASDGIESDAPELEISGDEVFSIPPDEVMSDAPEALDDDETSDETDFDDDEDEREALDAAEPEVAEESDVVVEASGEEREDDDVDVEMAVEDASPDDVSFEDDEEVPAELSMDAQATLEKYANAHEGPAPAEQAYEDVVAEADESDASFEEAFMGEVDEDGQPLVAAEPNVGGPVPKPSIAAPPEAPPAPTGLNLVPPPEGLTRPSRTAAEEALLDAYEEVGAEEESGLFRYENGLPIPSRPPLPDLTPARRVAVVEANDIDDVEDSEPPEAHDDYEEIRLSELAESAEEG